MAGAWKRLAQKCAKLSPPPIKHGQVITATGPRQGMIGDTEPWAIPRKQCRSLDFTAMGIHGDGGEAERLRRALNSFNYHAGDLTADQDRATREHATKES